MKTAEDKRKYNREWMRQWRARYYERRNRQRAFERPYLLIQQGKCPSCEMLLNSVYHIDCFYMRNLPFLGTIGVIEALHKKQEINGMSIYN